MLLVSRSGLVEEDTVETFHYYGFHLSSSSSSSSSSSPFMENNNVVFPFPFHIFIVGQLVVHPPSRIVSHPKDKNVPCPLPAHPPSEKAVGTW